MKKSILIIIISLILINLTAQDAVLINGLEMDSISQSKITVIHFDKCLGVIFPDSYAKKMLGDNIYWKDKVIINVDSFLIKKIDTAFIDQYCLANKMFIDNKWKEDEKYLIENETKKEYELAKSSYENQTKSLEKFCPIRQKCLKLKYKQYIAFKNISGEKVIYISLLNFENDQLNLKPDFIKNWIFGTGEWFETNTERYYYNVDKNRLSLNDDK
jgi:hypothetical protein